MVHGTRSKLTRNELERIHVNCPPIDEQRRIAGILGTIDETIEATERVVEKSRSVQKGILDRFLTLQSTNRPLSQLLTRIDGGRSPLCEERPPQGAEWGVLKVSSVTREDFKPQESKTLPAGLPPRADLVVCVGDVLTARANGVADLVGRTARVDSLDGRNLLLSDKTLRLVPSPDLSPGYLTYCMQHDVVRSQVRGLVSGSTGQGNISQKQLLSLLIPAPSISDQRACETTVEAQRSTIRDGLSLLAKLLELRAGLAADLLSGRVRTVPT